MILTSESVKVIGVYPFPQILSPRVVDGRSDFCRAKTGGQIQNGKQDEAPISDPLRHR